MSAEHCRPCKVTRVTQQYQIHKVDERLVEKREQEGLSLRDLEDYMGILILRCAMEEAGMKYIEGDPERYYRLLTDGESDLAVEQVRQRFRKAGVNVDALLEDIPSYQTIRHHLTNCLGKDTSGHKGASPDPQTIEETIRALTTRSERVAEKGIRRLRTHGIRDTGPVEVNTVINVTCADCGNTYGIYEILRQGCGCSG